MNEVFPDRMLFFGAFAGEVVIASSIRINVGRGMFYIFYCGDLPGYENLSPASLITQSIDDYAKAKGVRSLGVGTSTEDGIPNHGLINFKQEMGCVESLKLSLVKHLA